MTKAAIKLERWVKRGADAIKCKCGGYAERVMPTTAEEREHGCGNLRPGCCTRAFVCAVCKTRYVGQAEAPEMA